MPSITIDIEALKAKVAQVVEAKEDADAKSIVRVGADEALAVAEAAAVVAKSEEDDAYVSLTDAVAELNEFIDAVVAS